MTTKFYKQSVYDKWNMTEEQAIEEARKITIKGLRLTINEKMGLLFESKEFDLSLDDEDGMKKSILFGRKLENEFQQDMKNLKKMAKDAENYAVKVIGWNRKDFKETYDMYEILKDDMSNALDYWEAYGERAGELYLTTYV
jgi:hypothetical protein